jgi:regulatory protein
LNRKRRLNTPRDGRALAEYPDDSVKWDEGEVSAAAVALLARRDFSSGELTAKLRERGFAASAVHAVISDLQQQHFIDDARYATHRVTYQAGRGHGPQRIRRDLAELQVDSPLIDAALTSWNWAQQARDVRARKFGPELPADWNERARQARFLQYRGFSVDHIRSAFGSHDLDLDS